MRSTISIEIERSTISIEIERSTISAETADKDLKGKSALIKFSISFLGHAMICL